MPTSVATEYLPEKRPMDAIETGGFETSRLAARTPRPDDAPILASLVSENIGRWLASWPYPLSEDAARSVLASALDEARTGSACPFVIVEKPSGAIAGWLRIARRSGPVPACDLSYWIGEAFHRRGYAAEVAGAATDHAFRVLDVDEVFAGAQQSNAASFSVMARSGITFSHREDVWSPTRRCSEVCDFWSAKRRDRDTAHMP